MSEKQKEEIKELKTIKKIEQAPASEVKTIIRKDAKSKPDFVEAQSEDLISVNRKEYELLKTRYAIAKTALESVLCFIVPQNLRDLVNKALKEMAEAGQVKSSE